MRILLCYVYVFEEKLILAVHHMNINHQENVHLKLS